VPLVGDAAAWEGRRAQGFETLLANTVNGVRDMPPLGTCGACSEDDLRRLVAFVAGLPLPARESRP
jgi:cytochrome c5